MVKITPPQVIASWVKKPPPLNLLLLIGGEGEGEGGFLKTWCMFVGGRDGVEGRQGLNQYIHEDKSGKAAKERKKHLEKPL